MTDLPAKRTDLDDVIVTRRSIGRLTDAPVSDEVVRRLITLAVHAPNHRQTAPWRFVVIRGEARRRIGAAHADAYVRTHPDGAASDREREERRLERAPVVIAAIVHPTADDEVTRREDRDAVAAGIQNLLLAAHARGLGAIWRTGAMVDEPEVAAALKLDADDAIVGLIYLGMPDASAAPRTTPPVDAVTTWLDR